ncbi:hypothetical protein FBU30_004170 [Linnemannia zychae]|nr:hypothetical protein FBU30_004170 [Linnemannia zychae]
MDPLSRLPPECLELIIDFIAYRAYTVAIRTLAALLRVNRHIGTITAMRVYRDPFKLLAGSGLRPRGQRDIVVALLSDFPLSTLPTNVFREFRVSFSPPIFLSQQHTRCLLPPVLNYHRHLRHIPITLTMFVNHILRKNFQHTSDDTKYIEGEVFLNQCQCLMDRTHPSMVKRLHDYELKLYFYKVLTYRETIWILAFPILEQLETLTFPLSIIRRFLQVINRLGQLETLGIVMDEILEGHSGSAVDEASRARINEAMEGIVHFVETHTQLFKGKLKTVQCFSREKNSFPFIQETWSDNTKDRVYALLPPMQQLTIINSTTWPRLQKHPLTTDLKHVGIIDAEGIPWRAIVREYPGLLQRCRSLKAYKGPSTGKGSFRWAAVEKNSGSCDGRLVSLEKVSLSEYDSTTDEINVIAFAFSKSLRNIHVDASNLMLVLHSTIRIGKGWVSMPVLTHLSIEARQYCLLVDDLLIVHCPNLTHFNLVDNTTVYHCQDISTILPGQLERVVDIKLVGYPALMFHPETLSSTANLKTLRIYATNQYRYNCYIPPLDELNRFYGIQIEEEGGEGNILVTKPKNALYRPIWSWDWTMPQLSLLELSGEFAYRFGFQILHNCPALTELSLKAQTGEDGHPRVLTRADFFLPNTTSSNSGSTTPSPLSDKIIARALRKLVITGLWILEDDSLVQLLFHEMMPKLRYAYVSGVKGFSHGALAKVLCTKAKHLSEVYTSLSEPTLEDRDLLGLVPKRSRRRGVDVWHYTLLFGNRPYVLVRKPHRAT